MQLITGDVIQFILYSIKSNVFQNGYTVPKLRSTTGILVNTYVVQ